MLTKVTWLMKCLGRFCLAMTLFGVAVPALAHKASDSYLVIDVQGKAISGQWDIALRDIDFALPGGLDANGNGEITAGELRARQADIGRWALTRLSLRRGGDCAVQVTDYLVDSHTDGAYAVVQFSGECPTVGGDFVATYRLLFDVDALHRGLARLTLDGTTVTTVFAPTKMEQTFVAGEVGRLTQLMRYLVEGIWHIWIGFDHILFLLSLLLPAVLLHQQGRWTGVARFSDALREVVMVVTAFTVAHSITLSLAVLGYIDLPSRMVESAIAASVVLAAANNLKPLVEHRRWMVAFAFGLIHGFGFASVLAELGLPPEALALSLLGFNLGVEVGQLAIVSAFLPVAYFLRRGMFYRQWVFVGGSWATLTVALVWFIERAFDLSLIT